MSHLRPSRRAAAIAVSLLLALASVGPKSAPAQESVEPPARLSSLAKLAPADAGLCLESDQLGKYAADFAGGPLFQRLAAFPPLAKWVGQNGARIGRFRSEFQRRFGVSAEKVFAGIFGGRALFAVWPPAPGSKSGPVLLIVEARDRALLEAAIERIVALQRDSGKRDSGKSGQSFSLKSGEAECVVHVVGSQEKGEQLFLTSVRGLGMAANREDLIRRAFALYAGDAGPRESLGEAPGYLAGRQRLSPESSVRLFINPRPWDEGLLADWKRKPPESHDARVQKVVIDTWRSADYVIAGLQLDARRAALEGCAAWNSAALPQPVRDATESFSGAAEFIARIPDDALFAVAGRIDVGRLVWQFGLPAAAAQTGATNSGAVSRTPPLKADWLIPAAFAHGLGPNYGAYVAPGPPRAASGAASRASRLPWDWAAALGSRPLEPGDGRPPLSDLAEPVLHSVLAAAAAASEASAPISVTSVELGGRQMTSVAGLPLAGGRSLDFAYSVESGRFWLASSPSAIRRSLELSARDSLSALPPLKSFESPSQLVYLNLRGIRESLRTFPAILDFLAAQKGLDRDAARHSCRELLALGELADVALLAVRFDASGPAMLISVSADETSSPASAAAQ